MSKKKRASKKRPASKEVRDQVHEPADDAPVDPAELDRQFVAQYGRKAFEAHRDICPSQESLVKRVTEHLAGSGILSPREKCLVEVYYMAGFDAGFTFAAARSKSTRKTATVVSGEVRAQRKARKWAEIAAYYRDHTTGTETQRVDATMDHCKASESTVRRAIKTALR